MKKLDETYFDNAINELCKLMDDEPCFVKELIYEFARQIALDAAKAQRKKCAVFPRCYDGCDGCNLAMEFPDE